MTDARTASDLVGKRVQEIRKRRGWTAAQLAQRCAAIGATEVTESVLANIETGRRQNGKRRRDVTIDEVLILAAALNVPPVLLFTPVGTADKLAVTPSESVDPFGALMWVSGETPLRETTSEWRETAAPVTTARNVWRLYSEVTFTRKRGGDEYEHPLRELAWELNRWVETGTPFPMRLPFDWPQLVADMRERDLLRYPDEVSTYEVGDDSGGR